MQRIRSAGAASRRRTASAAAASRTCSQLSRITTAAAPLSRSISAGSPPVTCSAAISVSRTSSAVVAPSSRASQTAPGSVRPVAIATAVLPIPPGPTISTSRWSSSRSASAAISASRPTSSADSDGRFPAGASAERRVVPEDLLLELLQPRPGLEPELVGQPGPHALVGRQRVGLAPRPVERGDQQLPQALLVRVRRDGRLQLADHVVPELRAGREPGLDELHARLLEPGPVGRGPVAGRRQQLARVALRAQLGRAASIAGVEPLGGGRGVAEQAERVDRARLDREPVAALAAGDHRRVAERPPQPRDLRLQRVAVRRGARPQLVEQAVRAHEDPGLEREAHQQLRRLAARHRHGPPVAADLDGPQHRDLQHVRSLWPGVSEVSAPIWRVAACTPSS